MKKILLLIGILFLISIASALNAPYSYYKMDTTSGVIGVDQLNNFNITNLSSSHWTPQGKINGGYNVSLERGLTSNNLNSSVNWTFTFWMNRTGDIGDVGDIILGTGSSGDGNNNARFYVSMDNSGGSANKVMLNTYASSGNTGVTANNNFTQGQYYFVAIVLSQSNLSIFINGTLDNTVARSGYNALSNDEISFFNIPNANGLRNVAIDEIGLYNRILTPNEINQLYNSGNGLSFPYPPVTENSQTFSSPVTTLSTSPFNINISYDPTFTSVNGVLIYNNTNYPAIFTGGNGEATLSASATAPFVKSNTNINFFWNMSFTNSSGIFYFNSTTNAQVVQPISLDSCSSFSNVLLNFTNFDQDNPNFQLISSANTNAYQIDLKVGDASMSNFVNVSLNTTKNVLTICSQNPINQTFRIDYVVQYQALNHELQFYNVQNFTLSNTTLWQNISLYDLLTNSSTVFKINIKDQNFNNLQNALVEIQRKYVSQGNHLVVEIPVTDSQGNAVGHFVINNVLYDIYVRKNGQLLGIFKDVQLFCATGIDCSIPLQLSSGAINPSNFKNYLGILYTNTYNRTTKTYTFTYTTEDSQSRTVELTGILNNAFQNQTLCDQTTTSSSGTLTCTFTTPYENSSALITVFVNGQTLYTDRIDIPYSRSDILLKARYIIAAFLLPLFVLMTLSSPAIAVAMLVLGVIMTIGIYAIDVQSILGVSSILLWLIVASLVIIFKIAKGGQKNG